MCNTGDADGFISNLQCCVCGGGIYSAIKKVDNDANTVKHSSYPVNFPNADPYKICATEQTKKTFLKECSITFQESTLELTCAKVKYASGSSTRRRRMPDATKGIVVTIQSPQDLDESDLIVEIKKVLEGFNNKIAGYSTEGVTIASKQKSPTDDDDEKKKSGVASIQVYLVFVTTLILMN